MATNVDVTIFFLLLATTAVVVLCEEYNVVITTKPASGPFLVNQEIEFTCYVDPAPPEPVTFSWDAVKEANGTTTLRSQSSVNTTSYTPQYKDLHISWFFCKVFSNGRRVGVGRKRIEFHGFIFTEEQPVRSFNFGDMITLQINISNDSLASYIRTLTWYHNGTEVTNSSRITIQNNSRKLVVQNAVSDDAGTYRVEVTLLNFTAQYLHDPCCNPTWLSFLRNHAAYAPVTFTLGEWGSLNYCNYNSTEDKEPPKHYYPLVTGDSSTLLSIQDNETLPDNYFLHFIIDIYMYGVQYGLSVNGTMLTHNQREFNLSHNKERNANPLTKEINLQYNTSDEGFYIYLLYVSSSSISSGLNNDFRCLCGYYDSHVYSHLDINYAAPFSAFPFIVRTYKPPSVYISSYRNPETDAEVLVCSANGGIPDEYNITLTQQGVSVHVSGSSLQIPLNRLGNYVCTVESLYNTTTVMSSIIDKEPPVIASFQLHLVPENKFNEIQCLQQEEMEYISNSLVEDITNKVFSNFKVDFYNLTVNRSTSGNLLVRGVITGAEGNITASLLVDMLQVWLLTSTEEIRVTLGQQSFKVNSQCPPRVNSASPDLCDKLHVCVVDISRSTSGVIVGGTLVGGMILGVLGCIIVLCIGICILKLKNDVGMRQAAAGPTNTTTTATKEQEVVMDSKATDDTVELLYHLPTTAQPQLQGQHIED